MSVLDQATHGCVTYCPTPVQTSFPSCTVQMTFMTQHRTPVQSQRDIKGISWHEVIVIQLQNGASRDDGRMAIQSLLWWTDQTRLQQDNRISVTLQIRMPDVPSKSGRLPGTLMVGATALSRDNSIHF